MTLAHGVVVLFALFNVVCFIAFSFVGVGKFASRFVAGPAGILLATSSNALRTWSLEINGTL